MERAEAKLLLQRALADHFERLVLIWADGGYDGQAFTEWVLQHCGWVVERTFGWLYRFRRLSKDYEVLPETSEAWIYAAMVRIMLQRLARNSAVYV